MSVEIPSSKERLQGHGGSLVDEVYQASIQEKQDEAPSMPSER